VRALRVMRAVTLLAEVVLKKGHSSWRNSNGWIQYNECSHGGLETDHEKKIIVPTIIQQNILLLNVKNICQGYSIRMRREDE